MTAEATGQETDVPALAGSTRAVFSPQRRYDGCENKCGECGAAGARPRNRRAPQHDSRACTQDCRTVRRQQETTMRYVLMLLEAFASH